MKSPGSVALRTVSLYFGRDEMQMIFKTTCVGKGKQVGLFELARGLNPKQPICKRGQQV